jgi:hypothetical protein
MEHAVRITSFSDVRLGDNLAHLHFLRGVAKAHPEILFEHAAHLPYIPQLIELTADLPNIILRDLRYINRKQAINSWKNRGRFWQRHELKNDYGPFMLEWFAELAREMGIESPFQVESDLAFDYPAIQDFASEPFDFLIVNSDPMSGQWRSMQLSEIDRLAVDLSENYKVITTRPVQPFIPCTQRTNVTITGIGGLSRFCRFIVMVSTGPSWVTFNIWNRKSVELRIIFLEEERINIAPNTINTNSVGIAREILRERKFL